MHCVITGAVLTQEEIDQLMGKLESVTSILQEREKARLKETKVCFTPYPLFVIQLNSESL